MPYQYLFEPRAQKEYETSVEWYLEHSLQTTQKFISSVEEALALICEHPDRWKNQYKNFYEFGLKKFPFHTIYVIDKEKQLIIVISIYHQKRNPKKKFTKKKS